MVTFAVLPVEKGHGHYLSVGLCLSMVMLEVGLPAGLKGMEGEGEGVKTDARRWNGKGARGVERTVWRMVTNRMD